MNLAEGGNPVGRQMGREEAVPDRCSWFVVDGRKGPARALGRGHRRWHRARSCQTLSICPFCCARVFQVHQRLSPWQSVRVVYCSTVVPSDGEYTCETAPASPGLPELALHSLPPSLVEAFLAGHQSSLELRKRHREQCQEKLRLWATIL